MVGCAAALLFYCARGNRRGIYDFSTALFDLLLMFVGSLYYVAGSYEGNGHQQQPLVSVSIAVATAAADTTTATASSSLAAAVTEVPPV
jgi:hypothetical protein